MKITDEIKIQINNLYLKHGTYSAVAKEIGCAPTTVKKYIIPDYVPVAECEKKIFTNDDIPTDLSMDKFLVTDNFGDLCVLEKYEDVEVVELWKEMSY